MLVGAVGLAASPGAHAAAGSPVIVSVSATPARPHICRRAGATYICPSFGAAMVVSVVVRDASRCTFLRQPSVSSSLRPFRTVACATGRARVTVPAVPNPSARRVRLTYAVRVGGPAGRFAERAVTMIEVGAPPSPPEPPAVPPAPPPVTPVVPEAPSDVAEQAAWSGYSVLGGPFTAVTGTFDVPDLVASTGTSFTSEWVGIDGTENTSLIQAGVDEYYSPATRKTVRGAWWEIIPAASVPIPMTVSSGDRITVTIGQVSGTVWQIALVDDTTGQRFVINQTYTGPGESAEWIVEAPSPLTGPPYPLGRYVPAVTFTDLRINGTQTAVSESVLDQGSGPISVPSPLTANGFAVAYGAVPPPAP